LYIAEHEIRSLLHYETLIPAIRQALIDYSSGLVDQPPRMILRAGNADGFKNGWFAVMPVIAGDFMGVKNVTFYPGNAERGLDTHMATIALMRRATGEPLAMMDGRLITEMHRGSLRSRMGCSHSASLQCAAAELGHSRIRRPGPCAPAGIAPCLAPA